MQDRPAQERNVRYWPIADVRAGRTRRRLVMSAFDPKRTFRWCDLTPGMALSVEIRTGKRRVIDYLLNLLRQHMGEGMRER